MNSKITTKSKLSTIKIKHKQTKETTRTGTESQKWRSPRELSTGKRGWGMGEKVQGISSITGRYKTGVGG